MMGRGKHEGVTFCVMLEVQSLAPVYRVFLFSCFHLSDY